MKFFKRSLAVLLSLVLVLALFPAMAAMAADEKGGDGSDESGLVAKKTVRLTEDGTYAISLEAYATGKTVTTQVSVPVPFDIVLVLDQSGSMESNNLNSYTYTPTTLDWAYDDFGRNSPTRYYLYDGVYYQVSRGNYTTSSRPYYHYYLSFSANGTTYYLSGSGVTTTRPSNYNSDSTTIYTGTLYTRTTTSSVTRLQALKNGATAFINAVAENAQETGAEHRISVVGFSNGSGNYNYRGTEILSTSSKVNYNSATNQNYKDSMVPVLSGSDVNSRLTTAVDRVDAYEYTWSSLGMDMANKVFANNPLDTENDPYRQRIVVMFTDGVPCTSGWNGTDFSNDQANGAISNAYTAKNTYGATVYTIGVFEGADPSVGITNYNSNNDTHKVNRYMHYVSSNFLTAQTLNTNYTQAASTYYMAASDSEELEDIFKSIAQDISTHEPAVELDEETEVVDVISDYFILPSSVSADDVMTVYTVDVDSSASATAKEIVFKADSTRTELTDASMTIDGQKLTVSGFDFSENWCGDHGTEAGWKGKKLIVEITGVIPTPEAFTNEDVKTNDDLKFGDSGVYDEDQIIDKFESGISKLYKRTYVVDYAKQITIHKPLDSVYKRGNSPEGCVKGEALVSEYGIQNIGEDGSGTYTPNTTKWDGSDDFFFVGLMDNQPAWACVSIIPANNVYYEDDFVTSKTVTGITYTGDWEVTAATGGNTEDAALVVSEDGVEVTNEKTAVHGWVEALANDTTWSDGSHHEFTADPDSEETATAEVTFTGTGIDVYTKTDASAGLVLAYLKGENTGKLILMDDESKSGDYYQIPTLSFNGLEYGTYTLKLCVAVSDATDKEGRFTYSIDGIRIYNPIDPDEEADIVGDGYGVEAQAKFLLLKDIIPDDTEIFVDDMNKVSADDESYDDSLVGGVAAVSAADRLMAENEVYLGAGQFISLDVSKYGEDAHFFVGMKSLTGDSISAQFSNGATTATKTIGHTSDLYYEVVPDADGTITVKNASEGDGILSLTKLRVTGAKEEPPVSLLSFSYAKKAYNAFLAMPVVEYGAEPEPEVIETLPEIVAEEAETETLEITEAPTVSVSQPAVSAGPTVSATDVVLQLVRSIVSGFARLFK